MALDGRIVQELQESLLSAFNVYGLKSLVRFKLNENLDALATGDSHEEVVFKLISWAEQNGRIGELLAAAHEEVPGNAELNQFIEQYGYLFDETVSLTTTSDDEAAKTEQEIRRLDAAIPSQCYPNQRTEVRVLIALLTSDGLSAFLPDFTEAGDLIVKDDVETASAPIDFPIDSATGRLLPTDLFLKINAPDFELEEEVKSVRITPGIDSGMLTFFLTPMVHQGRARVSVEIYQDSALNSVVGSVALATDISSESSGPFSWILASKGLLAKGSISNKLLTPETGKRRLFPRISITVSMVLLIALLAGMTNFLNLGNRLQQLFKPRLTPESIIILVPATSTLVPTATPEPQAGDIRDVNGINFVYIPSGSFTMGSNDGDDDEKPPHTVNVDAFWMMQTEVTKAEYKRCMENGPCTEPGDNRISDPAFANHPVIRVDWYQATAYAEWIDGRLPTEAEWEYACRGTDGHTYPWGNDEPSETRLNYLSNVGDTTEVGSYPIGANGLYDMAGNVWEWTSTQYREYPYDADDGREEQDGTVLRTLRGGSFDSNDDNVRCANRNWFEPYNRDGGLGFRIVVVESPGFLSSESSGP